MGLALIGQGKVFFALTFGEVVEQLASLTTQAAQVDGCCAGLTWPASSLVEGLLQSISSLIGVIAWGSPSKLVIHLLAIIIPSWYEGLSAAARDGYFHGGEDGRAPVAVCCVWVWDRAGELVGCGVELGEDRSVCLPKVSPLDRFRWYRLDGGGGLDDGRPML